MQAESGIMGGKLSVGFLAPADAGANMLVSCENGDYGADLEIARCAAVRRRFPESLGAPGEVETPGVETIEALAELLGIDAAATSKAMPVVDADGTLVLVLVRGDDRLSEDEALRRPCRRVEAGDGRGDPCSVRRGGRLARPRAASRGRSSPTRCCGRAGSS